jgi:conjugative relaxase-like TrwC/TraI family protein
MLSVKGFGSADAAGTYYSHGDYYGREGEGVWHGKAAAELNLVGQFKAAKDENFKNILGGKLPSGQILGKKTAAGLQHRPGIDLTFSAPKSFSIEMLVNAEGKQQEQLAAALAKATQNTLDYIEEKGFFIARKGKGGIEKENIHKLIYAMFAHTTNRNLEPQAHTHCFVANVAACADGKYRSLDFDAVLGKQNNKIKYLGQIFRNELAVEVKKLGYQLTPITLKDGSKSFELAHIPETMIKAFSTRRAEIEAICAERGIVTKEGRDQVVIHSRKAKQSVEKEILENIWQEVKSNVVNEPSASRQLIKSQKNNQLTAYELAKLCIEDVSNCSSTFTNEELLLKIMKFSIGSSSIKEIEAVVGTLQQEKVLLKYGELYTTQELLNKEKEILQFGKKNIANTQALVSDKHFTRHLQIYEQKIKAQNPKFALNEQQIAAIKHVLMATDQITAIEGLPGVGKSTVLDAVRAITGKKVINLLGLGQNFQGAAPTASAAKTLADSANVESATLHRFIAQYDGYIQGRGRQVTLNNIRRQYEDVVLFVDEASLISTQLMWKLLKLQYLLQFRLVFIGDTKQLGAVEAGKPYEQLLSVIRSVNLTTIMRQYKEIDRRAVSAVAMGDVTTAFAIHTSNIKEVGTDNINKLATQVVGQYMRYKRSEREQALLISPSRKLRDKINDKVRTELRKEGELVGKVMPFTVLRQKDFSIADYNFAPEYKIGDTLLFHTEYKRQGIKKGDYFRVKQVHALSNSLVLEKNGKDIIFTLQKHSRYEGKLEVFSDISLKLQEGLKVRFTKNNQQYKLINSETAVILAMDAKKIKLRDEHKQVKEILLTELQHIDYGYCSTVHSAQGKTAKNTIAGIANNSLLNNQKSWLVTVSRHKDGFTAMVSDADKLYLNMLHNKGTEISALELATAENSKTTNNAGGKQQTVVDHSRYVYINKEPQAEALPTVNKSSIITEQKSIWQDYQEFILSPERVRALAVESFADFNAKLSKLDNLRFGSSGKINVNLHKGQWFDHSAGEGGSMYQLYKERYGMLAPSKIKITKAISTTKTQSSKASLTEQKKLAQVHTLIKNSIAIRDGKAKLAQRYLAEHRGINWQEVKLSEDIRFTDKAWSSESKSYHPGLVSIARDQKGSARATQIVYLDKATSNKNKGLTVNKRSGGLLAGSFVELTNNKTANIIFIAEGLETALSVAQSQKEARVLCSLGISNMANIDLSQEANLRHKKVVICADNDGEGSATQKVIALAAANFKRQGVKSVAVIRPAASRLDAKGKDFNDVLKEGGTNAVNAYIEPLLKKYPNYEGQFARQQAYIKELAQELQKSITSDALEKIGVYQDAKAALTQAQQLLQKYGFKKAMAMIEAKPQLLGAFKGKAVLAWQNAERQAAEGKASDCVKIIKKHLVANYLHQHKLKNHAQQQAQYQAVEQAFYEKYFSKLDNFNTEALDIASLQNKLLPDVQLLCTVLAGKVDFNTAKAVTAKVAAQIIVQQTTSSSKPSINTKREIFLRAYFEEKRQEQIRQYLLSHEKPKTVGEHLQINLKLERLLAIDSRHAAARDAIYYKPTPRKQVFAEFKLGEKMVRSLTAKYKQAGLSYAQANFIATETVKFRERYGVEISDKQLAHVKYISDHVGKHYAILRKSGFDKQEAKLAYIEGAKMFFYNNKVAEVFNIPKPAIEKIQQESKQHFEGLAKQVQDVQNPQFKATISKAQMQMGG